MVSKPEEMNFGNRNPTKKQKITHYFVVDSNERDNQKVKVVSDRPSEQDYEEGDDNVANQNLDLPKTESEKTKKRKFVLFHLADQVSVAFTNLVGSGLKI